MTISVKHSTVGTAVDDPAAEINKDEWNAEHTYTMATAKVLGRTTASTGAVEELGVVAPIALSSGNITTSMATGKLLGRGTAGTGVIEEITLGTNLSFTGTTLNAAGGGGGGALDDLTDVTITSPSNNQVLKYNGSAWVNGTDATGANADTTYIVGLVVTKNSGGNSLDISAGEAYVPAATDVVTYAGATAVSAGTLGNSQWNQVYIDGAGSILVVNNADPPSSAYKGTARKDGSDRRWIGSFRTNSSGNILAQQVLETGRNRIQAFANGYAPNSSGRALSVGTASSYGAETSLIIGIPRYVAVEAALTVLADFASGAGYVAVELSLDGSTSLTAPNMYVSGNGVFPSMMIRCPVRQSTPGIYYKLASTGGTTPSAYIDVAGYIAAR